MSVREEATKAVDRLIAALEAPLGDGERRAGWDDATREDVLAHFRGVRQILADGRPWTFARQGPNFARGFDGVPTNELLSRIARTEALLEDAKVEYVVSLIDRLAAIWNRTGPPVWSRVGSRLVELVGVRPGSRVLEFGTRSGHALVPAAERAGDEGRVVGYDVSLAMLARARTEIARVGIGNAEARLADWWGGLGELERLGERAGLFERIFQTLDYSEYLCGAGLPFLQSAWPISDLFVHAGRSRAPVGLAFELDRGREWAWYDELLARYEADLQLVERPLGTPQQVRDFCELWGLRVEQWIEERYPLVFASEDEWWDWLWAHESRANLELIDERRLASFREEAYERLQDVKQGRAYVLPFDVLYVVARGSA